MNNDVTVRLRPNRRFHCKFYVLAGTAISEPTTDNMGQLEQEFSLHSSGYFAKEKPLKPREIKEGERTVNEQESILVGTWTGSLARITHGMFCYIPSLRKLYAVSGDATDPFGDRKTVHIYIVDNVTQDVRQLMPGAPL
jgi:hypothetical protein